MPSRRKYVLVKEMAWENQWNRGSASGLAVGFHVTFRISIVPVILVLNFPTCNTLTITFQEQTCERWITILFYMRRVLDYCLVYCAPYDVKDHEHSTYHILDLIFLVTWWGTPRLSNSAYHICTLLHRFFFQPRIIKKTQLISFNKTVF